LRQNKSSIRPKGTREAISRYHPIGVIAYADWYSLYRSNLEKLGNIITYIYWRNKSSPNLIFSPDHSRVEAFIRWLAPLDNGFLVPERVNTPPETKNPVYHPVRLGFML